MEKTLRLFLLGIIALLTLWVSYLNFFKVPSLEREISDYEKFTPDTVVTTKVIQGNIDSTKIVEEYLLRNTESGEPQEVDEFTEDPLAYLPPPSPMKESPQKEPEITRTQTSFQDTLIEGTIYNTFIGPGRVSFAGVTYNFKKPIYTTHRVDTIKIENKIPVLKFRDRDPGWRFMAGASFGVVPSPGFKEPVIGFAPEIGFLTPEDSYIGYKYDVLNDMHWVTYKRRIIWPEISLW